MNLKHLKFAYDIADGDIYFVVNDPSTKAIKQKLTTGPLEGKLDMNIVTRADGVEIISLPKSRRNNYAFAHLIVVDPKDEVAETVKEDVVKNTPEKAVPVAKESAPIEKEVATPVTKSKEQL